MGQRVLKSLIIALVSLVVAVAITAIGNEKFDQSFNVGLDQAISRQGTGQTVTEVTEINYKLESATASISKMYKITCDNQTQIRFRFKPDEAGSDAEELKETTSINLRARRKNETMNNSLVVEGTKIAGRSCLDVTIVLDNDMLEELEGDTLEISMFAFPGVEYGSSSASITISL